MGKREQLWSSLENEEYREHLAADIGTGLSFQIRLLREKHGWTQRDLADRMGKTQEAISQWENPVYGRYTLSTLKGLAAAFDTALMVRFAPFSELVDWMVNLTSDRLAPPSYEEENARRYPLARASNEDLVDVTPGVYLSAVDNTVAVDQELSLTVRTDQAWIVGYADITDEGGLVLGDATKESHESSLALAS